MISFIVIGRNEGWKLTKCFSSIFKTIEQNSLNAFEVIYVDSKSTDDSIERAKEFKAIKIFQLTGEMNAAIARNVGAKESKGEVLFFIDGDMELLAEFLPQIYSEEKGLIHDFVSGDWENHNYNQYSKFLDKGFYIKLDQDRFEKTTGGLFLINRKKWEIVGGMNPIFKKSQDIDLGLRLAKIGIYLLRKKEISAKHHTIAYLNKNRMWKDLFSFNHLYGRSLLYRRHLFNKQSYSRLLRNDYTLLLLIVVSLLAAFMHSVIIFILYILAVLFRGKFKLNKFAYLIIRDLTVLFGFFFFWPNNGKNTQYIKIN
ncbi:glycosyltransferase family 2 protein [Patiriisocius sp. Uisw_017]|uniref:glycosyltransferase family 2 protein n=1 Tax=Patiriisocius sp. Uisw_017 TaxID=3230968 RepID=UPI0039EBECC5